MFVVNGVLSALFDLLSAVNDSLAAANDILFAVNVSLSCVNGLSAFNNLLHFSIIYGSS